MTESNRNRVRLADLKKNLLVGRLLCPLGLYKTGRNETNLQLIFTKCRPIFLTSFIFFFLFRLDTLSWGCLPYAFRNNNPECRYIIVVALFCRSAVIVWFLVDFNAIADREFFPLTIPRRTSTCSQCCK